MKVELGKMLDEGCVIFDGAMGTMLYDRGVFINRCFDEINLSNPDMVKNIHREYIKAGADIIETNTFGANKFKLKLHGIEDKVRNINKTGALLAREAAGDSALVAGSIGPLGIKIEPWGPTSNLEAQEVFKSQAESLLEGKIDLFILETFADLNEIHQAINAVKGICDLPVIAQMTLQKDGLGLYGTELSVFTRRLDSWGADVIGVNCTVGPKVMLEAVKKLASSTDKYISVQPNAGVPQNVNDRNIYMVSPEYLAEYAVRFVKAGANIVGGCCGTTPKHINAIYKSLREGSPPRVIHIEKQTKEETFRQETIVPASEKSRLSSLVTRGKFVKIVELVPPRGFDTGGILRSAEKLSEFGVNAINIPDSPRATSRMSALSLAVLIEKEIGIESLLHYCCRDRNILGMQSDLLGAQALGLRNLLIITGDPIKTYDYPDATAVFDIDSIGLMNVVRKLNHGYDIGDRKLKTPTSLFAGVGVNPGAIDFEEELKRFYWKVDAGAEFAVTQPVFDIDIFVKFFKATEHMDIPVIAGIWPLSSYRNAEFMNNELPGVTVPEDIMKRMKEARSGKEATREGVKIASELLEELKPMIAGAQISAPFNKHALALQVLDSID
ncbi:MAG: bifunctional homocysteine S-methyltransferase/methylenetetrahydrofolate reductase [Candidatus Krumholzibacteriota bacterium]|nr:bifunctional homocysteine S-methyltransferase/methylenetetrahydrofolate reductase [Candidatus Krumholzibacteriota bacterium]